MKEYIEREAALDVVKRTSGDYVAAWSEITHMPAADVAEVRHGRWISTGAISCKCSDCGKLQLKSHADDSNYCPNCGALMKEN